MPDCFASAGAGFGAGADGAEAGSAGVVDMDALDKSDGSAKIFRFDGRRPGSVNGANVARDLRGQLHITATYILPCSIVERKVHNIEVTRR